MGIGKFSVRVTRGRRVNSIRTPIGNRWVFYLHPSGGRWMRFDTERDEDIEINNRTQADYEFFVSDDLFEVKKAWIVDHARPDSTDAMGNTPKIKKEALEAIARLAKENKLEEVIKPKVWKSKKRGDKK